MTDEQKEIIEDWLERAKKADDSVKYWRSRLEHDRELASGNAKTLHDLSTHGNKSGNSTENILINLAEIEMKVQEKDAELKHICDEINSAIEKIGDENLQAVLTWHYLKFLTWENVAIKMNYSVSAVYYKRKKALKKLCSVLY